MARWLAVPRQARDDKGGCHLCTRPVKQALCRSLDFARDDGSGVYGGAKGIAIMQKMEREWHLRRGDLKGATNARREFARYLTSKSACADDRYDATLIFGELVANAVKCARSSVTVELLEDGWSSLRVTDDGDCFDASSIAPQPLTAQSGRGLYIVNQLARHLEVASNNQQCEVYAELPIRS
jgi:anti-sigma regulatory factor (Ser/Thr protein kinase)